MSHRRNSDRDRSDSGFYHRDSGGNTTGADESFDQQHNDYHSRRTHGNSQGYEHNPSRERDTSSTTAAQRDPPALRSCFAGNRRHDEPHRDPHDSDRPRQRYAEIFKPRRRSPSPIRQDRRAYFDNDYGDDSYHRSSRHHKPDHRRSGSRQPIAFEAHRSGDNRYVRRYSPQYSDCLYDDTPRHSRSSREGCYDGRYDGEDEYRRRRR